MKINLVYISNSKKASHLETKIHKRLASIIKVNLTRIQVKIQFKKKIDQCEYEAKLVAKKFDLSKPFFCFDKEGKKYSTEAFSKFLINLNSESTFIIGGTYGISQSLKLKSSEIISLSDMEFSHEVFRIMILEQFYRVSCVINNHPFQQIEE